MSVDCFCDMVQRCSIYPIRTTHSVPTHTCTHLSSSAQCSVYRAPRTIHGRSGVTHMFLLLQWPTLTVLSIISMLIIGWGSTFTETQCSIFLSLSFEIRLQVEKRQLKNRLKMKQKISSTPDFCSVLVRQDWNVSHDQTKQKVRHRIGCTLALIEEHLYSKII